MTVKSEFEYDLCYEMYIKEFYVPVSDLYTPFGYNLELFDESYEIDSITLVGLYEAKLLSEIPYYCTYEDSVIRIVESSKKLNSFNFKIIEKIKKDSVEQQESYIVEMMDMKNKEFITEFILCEEQLRILDDYDMLLNRKSFLKEQ